jgi:hypothetical protein
LPAWATVTVTRAGALSVNVTVPARDSRGAPTRSGAAGFFGVVLPAAGAVTGAVGAAEQPLTLRGALVL